ncbi:unnamed protein product [Vicia faba]|uniref:Uncharacterized protein n=1 Tax=Vicia faba TaxID=3906 RepID=A0AAV1B356_VICFA|nr:unnamed protein product [Vicia faba]
MITGKPPDITMLQRIGIAQEYGLVDYPNATVPMSIWLSVDESFIVLCHFQMIFEDSVRNIQAGKRFGLIQLSIHNLAEAVPNLWEVDVKSEAVYTENLAKETKVTA